MAISVFTTYFAALLISEIVQPFEAIPNHCAEHFSEIAVAINNQYQKIKQRHSTVPRHIQRNLNLNSLIFL